MRRRWRRRFAQFAIRNAQFAIAVVKLLIRLQAFVGQLLVIIIYKLYLKTIKSKFKHCKKN